MEITRERFVSHFWPCVHVHAIKLWSLTRKDPPLYVARAMYEAMQTSAGDIPISSREWRDILEPVILEVHKATPYRKRPAAADLLGRAYDALDKNGVNVTIRPTRQPHSK